MCVVKNLLQLICGRGVIKAMRGMKLLKTATNGGGAQALAAARSKHHGLGLLHKAFEFLKPLSANGTVDHAVITRQSDGHDLRDGGAFAVIRRNHRGFGCAYCENAGLRGVDDGAELLDAEHAEVGDGERATLEFLGLQLLVASTRGQILAFECNLTHAMGICVGDDGGDETIIGGDGDADVDVVVSADAVAVPAAVDSGHFAKRKSACFHHKVVDADFGRVVGDFVQAGTQGENGIHADVNSEVEVRNTLLRFDQALRDDFADVGVGNIGVGPCGLSGRDGGCDGCRGGSCGSYARLHISSNNASTRAGARSVNVQVGSGGDILGKGGHEYAAGGGGGRSWSCSWGRGGGSLWGGGGCSRSCSSCRGCSCFGSGGSWRCGRMLIVCKCSNGSEVVYDDGDR